MGRISRQVMYLDMARAASRRSTCFRLNVGAIVTHQNSPVSVGWNGAAPGMPHCAGNDCPGIVPGNCGTLHAEANALDKANSLLMEFNRPQVDLYATHSPCLQCCEKMIASCLNLQVQRLFFEIPYRNTQHLGMLQEHMEVYTVTAAGYIVDYFSNRVIELP